MFGYVRPLKGELKVRHYEMYQAAYCGLCRSMKKQYGFVTTLFLNYDMAFLAALLLGMEGQTGYCDCRCIASPFRKKRMCKASPALAACAAAAVILTCGKLRDEAFDNGFWKTIAAKTGLVLLRPAENKASAALPRFAGVTKECLAELSLLEKENCVVLDQTADTFARILEAACDRDEPHLRRLLYQVGRWIYLIDAADDLKKDCETGQYNPIAARFAIKDGLPGSETKRYVLELLTACANLACAEAVELELGDYGPVIGNILALGLPFVSEKVLKGCWRKKRRE